MSTCNLLYAIIYLLSLSVPRPPEEEINEQGSGHEGGGHANEEGRPQPMVEIIEDLGEEDYQYDDEFEEEEVSLKLFLTCT